MYLNKHISTGTFISNGFTFYEENRGGGGIFETQSDFSCCTKSVTIFPLCKIQWEMAGIYGEDQYAVMMAGVYIE